MPDEFGLVNPVLSPILERVVREERLGRDLPRKQRERKAGRSREDEDPDGSEQDDGSMSSTHIDLRV